MDEPHELWVRVDSPTFADEVVQGVRAASKRGLYHDGEARRIVRDGVTYHVQSFADRVYFYDLRHLLLYRSDEGWTMCLTTAGLGLSSSRLFREASGDDRTPLPSDVPLAEAQELALKRAQDHSRERLTVHWQEAKTRTDSWVGEVLYDADDGSQ